MYNARIRLRVDDFNTRGARREKAALRKHALGLRGESGGDFGADLASAKNPESVSSISDARRQDAGGI